LKNDEFSGSTAILGEGCSFAWNDRDSWKRFTGPWVIEALERIGARESRILSEIGVGTAQFGPGMVRLRLVVIFAATAGVVLGIFDFRVLICDFSSPAW
jgi:hypothetical protein